MRSTLLVGAAAAGLALAQPHVHGHQKKDLLQQRDVVEEHVSVTVIECWLGGRALPEEECQAGINNGTLKWAGANAGAAAVAPSPIVSTERFTVPATQKSIESSSASAISPSSVKKQAPSPSPTPSPSPSSSVAAAPSPAAASSSSSSSSVVAVAAVNKAQATPAAAADSSSANVNSEFPDGVHSCSEFPSSYGAVALDWLNIGGWASVQKPGVTNSAGYDNILGVTRTECGPGGCCLEGSFCSYACSPGYLKFQWPSVQGATGQSVGGLLCKGGKLYKTNPSVKTLCGLGTQKVKVFVKNTMSQNVAICRTNYPGDEKMSIPVDAQPGTTRPLACPDGGNYYEWQGKPTSAQYYINPAGYSVEKACVWGNEGDDFGNWSPGNLGVGYSNGAAWLSIMANLPTQPKSLKYTVEITGDNTSDKCRYRNGQYCSGANYQTCNTNGCTVSAASGNVYYVLSD